jgi:serine protease
MLRLGSFAPAGLACCLVFLARLCAAAAPTPASAPPEYNPVRAEPVSLGPEANRLLVGFRATADNSVTETVISRARAPRRTVTLANTTAADAVAAAGRAGLAVAKSRQITPSMHVLYLPNTLYGADLEAALAKLRADPALQFAVIDKRRYALAVTPDDPLFIPNPNASPPSSGQWYMDTPSSAVITLEGNATMDLSATDAVSAWGITTGSDGIVIADVDTGVRFDHPDLLRAGFGGRLLPGYDFVGQDYDPTSGAALGTYLIANDGDGWDPDPSDPGDWVTATDQQNPLFASDTVAPSSWHGTRVVGIMGALSNNGIGIAAMTWGAWILPVRALGKGGSGYDSDIIAGMEWAAGLSVVNPDGPPVPPNPYPADIVNLSIGGGTDACTSSDGSAYETALRTLTGMGVLVVISAGNSNGAVELPANCATVVPGVMAVAGLRNVGTKVGYSSFGAQVSVSAPAGNCVTASGDCLRSIDTTTNLGTTTPGANSYTDEVSPNINLGTSFSAPIVSGIAALMKSVNNNLTPVQIIGRMQAAASPFPAGAAGVPTCPATSTSGECACPNNGSQCGAGMVDAFAAVEAAQKPIAVIVLPAVIGAGSVIDAGASVAGCNTGAATPAPLAIASFAWSASPSSIIVSGAAGSKVTIDPSPGTLTLKVTDSAGNRDTETVTLTADAATTTAPSAAGGSKSACPVSLEISPVAPTVTANFYPASVPENSVSTLTITLANANGFALTQSSLQLTLPTGLTLASAPATTCTGAAHSLMATATSVALSGANIAADGDCTITLALESAASGTYTASIAAQALDTAPAGGNPQAATADLTVSAPPSSGGGGALDGWDLMLAVGVVLIIRAPARRRLRGDRELPRSRRR